MSVNTKTTYNVGLKKFKSFRQEYGLLDNWPPELEHVVQFISYLSLQGLSYSTARSYVSAVSFQCKIYNKPDITNNFLVAKVLKGLRKNKKSDSRLPISPGLLKSILHKLVVGCSDSYEVSLFSAAYTLAYCGFFRVGEIAVSKNDATLPDRDRVVAFRDISLDLKAGIIEIHIRFSKTDQYGSGSLIRINKTDKEVCPVKALAKFLALRPQFQGPLLIHYNKQPLTRYQFSAMLKKSVALIGLNYSVFKSHSFRIGAATSASQLGFSVEDIKKAGRWSSEAYQSYVRPMPVIIPNILG